VVSGAPGAQKVALKAREVVITDLVQIAVLVARPAHGARRRLRPGYRRGDNVLASFAAAPKLKVGALAALTARGEDDPVDAGRAVLRRHEPDAVQVGDLLPVLAVEGDAPKLAGGWVRGCARLCSGHEAIPSWSGPRGVSPPPGPFLYDTDIIAHTQSFVTIFS